MRPDSFCPLAARPAGIDDYQGHVDRLLEGHAALLAQVMGAGHFAVVRRVDDDGVLVQALLDAPMFPTRWRWVTNISLAVPRMRGGKRVPAPFQRNDAEDLVALVFPDQLACFENIQTASLFNIRANLVSFFLYLPIPAGNKR